MFSESYHREHLKRGRETSDDIFDKRGKFSDEDTEDASEADSPKKEELKEQVYQDKLHQIKLQLQQLKDKSLPDYQKRLKRVETQSKEALQAAEFWKDMTRENISHRFVKEQQTANQEFEAKKIDLKDSLLVDLEEKKKNIESDRHHLDIGDTNDFKSKNTRRLRPRANEPVHMPEKRRKTSPTSMIIQLTELEIQEDLKFLAKVSGKPFRKSQMVVNGESSNRFDARVEDGKLYYEKRWFNRGQAVYIESKETGKYGAVIMGITPIDGSVICVKKVSDNSRQRIFLSEFQKGKFTIKRRST